MLIDKGGGRKKNVVDSLEGDRANTKEGFSG